MSDAEKSSELKVKVIPNASRDEIVGWYGNALKIKTKAPPEAGKANKAICAILAKELGLPKQSITIKRGSTNPLKVIQIKGLEDEELLERLPR